MEPARNIIQHPERITKTKENAKSKVVTRTPMCLGSKANNPHLSSEHSPYTYGIGIKLCIPCNHRLPVTRVGKTLVIAPCACGLAVQMSINSIVSPVPTQELSQSEVVCMSLGKLTQRQCFRTLPYGIISYSSGTKGIHVLACCSLRSHRRIAHASAGTLLSEPCQHVVQLHFTNVTCSEAKTAHFTFHHRAWYR